MFKMVEIEEIFNEEDHNTHTLDQLYDGDDVLKEPMAMDDFSSEAQLVRGVLLSLFEKKKVGAARMPVERICALQGSRC